MKTTIPTILAVALLISVGASLGQERGAGLKLMQLSEIKTQAAAEALKPGDSIAMVCSKCKSVTTMLVTTESKDHVKKLIPGEKHLCPGCNSTIEVVGHGKAKTDVIKHICKACGDDSAFCCAIKPGAGATAGMEKK